MRRPSSGPGSIAALRPMSDLQPMSGPFVYFTEHVLLYPERDRDTTCILGKNQT